jgi:hypothetical protein
MACAFYGRTPTELGLQVILPGIQCGFRLLGSFFAQQFEQNDPLG